VLLACGVAPVRGGDFDRWDLEVRGLLGGVRIRHAIEEHGAGRQLTRYRVVPKVSSFAVGLAGLLLGLAVLAGLAGAWFAAVPLAVICLAAILLTVREAAVAEALALAVVSLPDEGDIVSDLEQRVRIATEATAEMPGVAQ
jgi:uncharacterized membrane protein YphA (DoxX/SURF4 family)